MTPVKATQGALAALANLVLDRTMTLCAIPAPPLHEEQRGRLVAQWWRDDGLQDVHPDSVGNVRARLRTGLPGLPALVVCAHLDTVFGTDIAHVVTSQDGRLVGPGVGDDTVAVCALSALDTILPPDLRHPVWIVATVGEEGLGNLAGVRALLADPPSTVRAMIALEGNYLGRVNVVGVGSVRWEVTVTGPGGHAWEDAHQPSAVHAAAGLITSLDTLAAPGTPKATVNVGRIEGGESVNSRAERVTFLVDLRSGDPARLEELRRSALELFASVPAPLEVVPTPIGDRPAGALEPHHPLAQTAADALDGIGIAARFTAASTDANAAYAQGIPAITLGITTGEGTHTEQEWIDVAPIADGLRALATTVARLDEKEW
jgi:tripeptide aminopeptidase